MGNNFHSHSYANHLGYGQGYGHFGKTCRGGMMSERPYSFRGQGPVYITVPLAQVPQLVFLCYSLPPRMEASRKRNMGGFMLFSSLLSQNTQEKQLRRENIHVLPPFQWFQSIMVDSLTEQSISHQGGQEVRVSASMGAPSCHFFTLCKPTVGRCKLCSV